MDKLAVFNKAVQLIEYHKNGDLGGSFMPEDQNPNLKLDSKENYLFFTLPMALNYQRNAYRLWESSLAAYRDPITMDVFSPKKVLLMSDDKLREKLVRHKVALQMNKQPVIWRKLCETFTRDFNSDVRVFFNQNNYSVKEIKAYMLSHKKDFPYLSGNKIMNYWLYVMSEYTDLKLIDRENISVAPDTNVIQASLKLGLISKDEFNSSQIQQIVAKRWEEVFEGSEYQPIDIHTPLWLWNRSDFSHLKLN